MKKKLKADLRLPISRNVFIYLNRIITMNSVDKKLTKIINGDFNKKLGLIIWLIVTLIIVILLILTNNKSCLFSIIIPFAIGIFVILI